MAIQYYNSSFGTGFEGIVNYSNLLTDLWMVPIFLIFVFIAIVGTLSKREDKQFPVSAIVSYALLAVLIAAIIFKLMTSVPEYIIYMVVVSLGIAIAWGVWQTR